MASARLPAFGAQIAHRKQASLASPVRVSAAKGGGGSSGKSSGASKGSGGGKGGSKGGGGGGKGGGDKTPMTREDASRIQSAEARSHGGGVEKGSFASRAQSAAYKNEPLDPGSSQSSGGSSANEEDFSD